MNLESQLTSLNIEGEQLKDVDIQKAISWTKKKSKRDTTYSSCGCQKYHKQLNRLVIDDGILYRKSYDHIRQNFTKESAKTGARRTNF